MHDRATGEAFSEAFLAAREHAHDLGAQVTHLRLSGADHRAVAAAIRAADKASAAAFEQMLNNRKEVWRQRAKAEEATRQERAEKREVERLAEQEEATLQRILLALRHRGPLTGGELEALRIRGASHNLLRPVLRVGVQRGLVKSQRDGRRVLWSAVPQNVSGLPQSEPAR